MLATRIEEHIDRKILEEISNGNDLHDIMYLLKSNCDKFMKRDSFISVSRRYIINNWNSIQIKKRYTTYYVIHSKKRKDDIEWIIKNRERFNKNLTNDRLFKLILLKESLK
jgi:hypothetical protein